MPQVSFLVLYPKGAYAVHAYTYTIYMPLCAHFRDHYTKETHSSEER